jgi:hypothetical protein
MLGLPLTEIASDLNAGAGRELDSKICAAHSSAALVVNTFGPWRNRPEGMSLSGLNGFRSVRFESKLPTGLGGTPPHLDLLAEGEATVAIESKCTEWMEPKPARFSPSYDSLSPSHGHSPWFELIQQLLAEPCRYEFLDAAQLVKHALGLLTCYGALELRLIYLYWEPHNAADWPECRKHRGEADDLANQVKQCSIRLQPMSYRELWEEWAHQGPPPHLPYLRARYDCTV